MDFNGIRRLCLPLRPKVRVSPGRKTPPGGIAPSAGLRPLSVSRVKCGGGPCRGHSVLLCTVNTICRKHVVVATRLSPFKVGDNQRPKRTMTGVRKPTPESSVLGENLTRGRRRNQFWRGYGSPSVLNEVFHEFSTAMRFEKCKRSP